MKQLKLLVPDQCLQKNLKKIKRPIVHPLVMYHNAAAIRWYRLSEFIEQIAPTESRIPLLAGVQINIHTKIR
jgi:hypothetical protein